MVSKKYLVSTISQEKHPFEKLEEFTKNYEEYFDKNKMVEVAVG